MSTRSAYRWVGGEGRGFMKKVREMKRAEAEQRNARYRTEIQRVMADHNISEPEAKRARRGTRLVERAKAARRAPRGRAS